MTNPRIYYLPQNCFDSNSEQIWIGLQIPYSNQLFFPHYLEVFSSFITQPQYEEFMKDLKQYMNDHAVSIVWRLLALLLYFWILPLLILYSLMRNYVKGAQRFVKRRAEQLEIKVSINLARGGRRTLIDRKILYLINLINLVTFGLQQDIIWSLMFQQIVI